MSADSLPLLVTLVAYEKARAGFASLNLEKALLTY